MQKNVFPVILTGILILTMCNTTNTTVVEEIPLSAYEETAAPSAVLRSAPFTRGMNFSGWFEAFSAEAIPYTRYTEQDFIDAKSLGADVIRLPVRMHSMTSGAPNYTINPLLFKFLDSAIDWAEKTELYLILDNHSFDPDVATSERIDEILIPVWAQMADRYKDRSDYLIYEILNEPHGISAKRWGEIQGAAIETIRAVDQKHTIIVGGAEWNSIDKLSEIPVYADANLMYTFHFYDPFLFTHQGASWGEPLLVHLEGVPFPYDRKRMPSVPRALRGHWIESSLRNEYRANADPKRLYSTLDKVVAFSRERNVPVFCGEFGVYLIQSPPADRVKWYQFVANALNRRNIAWTSWDYYGGFGIYNTSNGGNFDTDLNVDVLHAMGFTPPPQLPPHITPRTSGFVIYDDYPTKEFTIEHWGAAEFSMYDTSAAQGDYAIRWGNGNRYDSWRFLFSRNSDLSQLVEDGYYLELAARAESPVHFDIRFVNPENVSGGASDIPWRMRYSIDTTVLPADGQWHVIRIPLQAMQEQGAWVNTTQRWLNPRGEFSWQQIRCLEFAAEHEGFNSRLWFDSVQIVAPQAYGE